MSTTSIAIVSVGSTIACISLGYVVLAWANDRASRLGAYGTSIGGWLGVDMRPGDPTGSAAGLPPRTGVHRATRATGTYGASGRTAIIDETTGSSTTTVFHVWIHAGLDADIIRTTDGATERTHATRGGLADRAVGAIAAAVPDAHLVWSSAGSAPPPSRDEYDRASASLRPVGIVGDDPVGGIGLALRVDLMTNPVAWLRWLREVVWAVEDEVEPPAPPSVGFA